MNFGNQCFYKDVEMLVITVVFGNKLSVSHISNYRYYQEVFFLGVKILNITIQSITWISETLNE